MPMDMSKLYFNSNLSTEVGGEGVQKTSLSKGEGMEGREKSCAACPRGQGSNLGPSACHATEVV